MNFLQILRRGFAQPNHRSNRWRDANGMGVACVEQLEIRTLPSVDFVQVADSLDQQLVTMQDRITEALSFFQTGPTSHIPIVGDQLGRAADIVSSFRDELREAIEVLGTSAPTDLQLQTSLAGRLTPFLGASGIAGVHVSRAGDVATVEMVLQGSAVVDGIDIGFSTGLPSLPFQVTANGSLEISVGFALDVAFTINVTTGSVALVDGARNLTDVSAPDDAHPLLDANSDLALFVTAGPSNDFNAKAVIGFVEGTAAPIPGMENGLYATALVSNLLTAPSIKLDGRADANLRLAGAFAGSSDDFPGISTDFHFHWGLSSADQDFGAPTVAFDNVSLTFGTFLSNVLRPTLEPIKDALDPISPVLTLLTTKVPGISDLSEAGGAGPIRILDLAVLGSNLTGNGPLGELAGKIADLLAKIDSIQIASNISLPLGGFDLNTTTNGDLRKAVIAGDFKDLSLGTLSPLQAANLNNLAQSASQSLNDKIDDLAISDDLKNELHGLNALSTQNGFQIAFPILNDPASVVFNMLLGRDSDLFYFKADADVQLNGSRATGLSFANQPIKLVGDAHIQTHLKIAYDTFGLRQLITNLAAGDASNIVSDITDGLYVSDDSYFKMSGSLTAGFDGTAANVIPLSISGGLYTQEHGTVPVHIYIEDPNGDGKLRINEFHLGDDGQPAAFRTTGQLLAGLSISVGFPDPDGPGGFPAPPNEDFDVVEEPIFTFGIPTPLHLASQPDASGEITLYLGTNAHLRANGANDEGDEKFVIEHLGTNPNGSENVRIRAFGLVEDINNVRSIVATDQVGKLEFIALPGVTSSADITGGQGAAELSYFGTGTARLTGGALASTLKGGSGPSILIGGPGDDTIILGSGTNTVDAAGSDNTVIVTTPVYENSTISGGTTGHNNLRILGSPTTTAISATPVGSTIDLGIQNGIGQDFVQLNFSNFDDVYVNASFSPTNFMLGDLAAAGVTLLTLDMQSPFPTARSIDLDTRVGNALSVVAIHDYVYQVPDPARPNATIDQHGAVIVNTTTGLTTRLLGFHSQDTLTLRHHGGGLAADALPLTGGNFIFDTSERATNAGEIIHITTPARPGGFLSVKDSFRDVLIELTDYSTFRIQGSRAIDDTDLFVAAASSGANTIDIDAASVHGEFNVALLGDATAVNHVTLRKAGLEADVSILGQNTTADLLLGVGQLSAIRHDVFASNVQLTVNNTDSELASILALDATTFGNWNIPTLAGVTPHLTFSNLRNTLTIFAGSGDRFQLDVTPASITGLVIHNEPPTDQSAPPRDPDLVYTANWSIPLTMLGNFSFYAGRVLHRDGTVERIKRIAQVNSSVTLRFAGIDPSEVILDADLDPPGAIYGITGSDFPAFNTVANTTVGLTVVAYGYRQQDRFYIYATGATIQANLQQGPPAQFYFDGQARLGPTGIHPTEPNDITIATRYGTATMTPLAQYNSLLDMFNDVYILGAMPQDSLDVNMPTHVRMTSSIGEDLKLELNPEGGAVFNGDASSLVSWLADIPQAGQTGSQQVFVNIRPVDWDAFFAPGAGHGSAPNPFITQPYGVDIAHQDASASVTLYRYETIGGVRTRIEDTYNGSVRYWLVDPHPVAVNNDVDLDASHLRGDFKWNVTGPDYDYIRQLDQASMFFAVTQSVSFSAPFFTWGTPHDFMRIAFGQSDISLSHVNPESTVEIHSDNGTFTYDTPNMSNAVVSSYPITSLNVGAGVLANIQGDVAVDQVQLEIDDRNGAMANILDMTSHNITWTSAAHRLQTLTTSNLRGDLTLTGGAIDRVAVDDTPAVEGRVLIRNLVPATEGFASPGVYVMKHSEMHALDVVGNLNLSLGRRLLADGTVQNVGDLSGLTTFETDNLGRPITSQTVNYTYTGAGKGSLVYDGSNFTAPGPLSLNQYPASIASAGVPDRAALHWGEATFQLDVTPINSVSFGDNTDLKVYAPITGFFTRASGRSGILIDNPTAATIEYFSNPLTPATRNDYVNVSSSAGPLEVTGRGSLTKVLLQPYHANFSLEGDLRSLITGDVSVTNAALQIVPTNTTTPGAVPQPVVLSNTQLTGVTGGVVSFSNLASFTDITNFTTTGLPGLSIGMPHYGATSLTVNGTPSGVITAINTVKDVPIGPTTVTGTNGELWLGLIAQSTNVGSDTRTQFRTSSLVIGDGDLNDIQGAIALSPGSGDNNLATSGITINNQNGTPAGDVEFDDNQEANPRGNSVELSGLSPAPIFWKTYLTSAIEIRGSANSHYTISRATDNLRLFAGEGSTVDVFRTGPVQWTNVADMSILGAADVTFNAPENLFVSPDHPLHILPDPSRPASITDLTFNSTQREDFYYVDSPAAGQGRIAGNSFTQAGAKSYVVYDSAHTNLTLLGVTAYASTRDIRVLGTPALTTTINPGNQPLHVAATTNPLDIHLPSGSHVTLGSTAQGSTGDTRQLLGNIAITVEADASNPAAIRFNSSADATPRSIGLNQVSADELTVTGMTATPVDITGHAWTLALDGGAGNNTIVGPNVPSNWLIDGANAGKLNQTVSFTGMRNVVSGSQDDAILFKPGGTLAGNLDGGAGVDTLNYLVGMLTGADVIDLPNHIAPRVTGQALNLESSGTFTILAATNPGSQESTSGSAIAPLNINTTGGFGTKQYSATGLPDGISIDSQTGVLTGTPLTGNQFKHPVITITDSTGSASVDFTWHIQPGLTIVFIPSQTVNVEEPVSLQVEVTTPFGGTLTYSATGLPPGLSIDSDTGLITGTVPDGSERPEAYASTISVTDGTHSTQQTLNWSVVKPVEVVTFSLSPATVPENSANGTVVGNLTPDHVPQGVTFTYSLTDNAGGRFAINGSQVVVANGAALDFEANTSHVITVRIEDSNHNVQTQDFTITVTDVTESTTVRYVKNHDPVSLIPSVLLAKLEALGGGTLRLSLTDVAFGKKQKRFDVLALSKLNELGTVSAPQILNEFAVVTVQLNANVTAAQIQEALQGVKFSTSGKGLKTSTRNVKVEAMDASAVTSTIIEQIVQVLKKQPRQ